MKLAPFDKLIYEHVFLAGEEDEVRGPDENELEPDSGSDPPDWAQRSGFHLPRGDDKPVMRQEGAGRSVVRRNCEIQAFFGLSIYDRSGTQVEEMRVSEVQPEIRLLSHGSLGIRIAVARVADVPGTLTIRVLRDATGTQAPPERSLIGDGLVDLIDAVGRQLPIGIPAPPGINASGNRVVAETLVMTVTWVTAAGQTCALSERLNVRWEYANPVTRFRWWRPQRADSGRDRTSVAHGRTLRPYTDPDGRTFYCVPIQTFHAIEDPARCCAEAGTHAVIQFVRHEWRLLQQPALEGGDGWSLDVLQGQIDRAIAQPVQDYDPTFTHDPLGSAPDSAPLVYPGPDANGRQSVSQYDRPGIPTELHDRLKRANPGSEFVFHFMSLLICQRVPSSANDYLVAGMVQSRIEYRLRFIFRGRDREPEVTLQPVSTDVYVPCQSLSTLLQTLDRQRRRLRQGSLMAGYRQPRGHTVAIPSGD